MRVQRDDELIVIEKRNFFSLFCLDLEAQLVHINLTQLTEVYEHLVNTQVKGHVEVKSDSCVELIYLSWLCVCVSICPAGMRPKVKWRE